MAAPITTTIETLSSSVASSEPAASVIPAQPTAAPVPDPTQTASASLPAIEGQVAQNSGLDDDGTQFHLAPRTSAPGSSATAPPTDPYVLVFDAKGGEGSSMLGLGGATYLGGA